LSMTGKNIPLVMPPFGFCGFVHWYIETIQMTDSNISPV
jgi:hypothetical protein